MRLDDDTSVVVDLLPEADEVVVELEAPELPHAAANNDIAVRVPAIANGLVRLIFIVPHPCWNAFWTDVHCAKALCVRSINIVENRKAGSEAFL